MNARPVRFLAAGAVAVSSLLLLHRLARRSGATDAEVFGSLPGDTLVAHPQLETIRAITINASAAEIWPWLIQMGYHRGGWYTNPRLDKIVWQIDNPSLDTIAAELQDLHIGDIVPDGPEGTARFTVAMLDREHALVLLDAGATHVPNLVFSWAFVLREIDANQTRLLVRVRATFPPRSLPRSLAYLLLGIPDYIMAQVQMLRGIKQRVERTRWERAVEGASAAAHPTAITPASAPAETSSTSVRTPTPTR